MYEVQEPPNASMKHWVVEDPTVEVREKPRLFRRLAWYRRRVESLEQQTVIDELTGLRNQRALWRELSRRTPSCSESAPLAVVMVDFDLFREVNDAYGHAVGDAVLRRAGSVLRSAAPTPRLAFRYGGEEFVLLAETGRDEATELAERVRAGVVGQNGALPTVTVSCGVAEIAAPVEPWIALDLADSALRDAKRAGRNRVVVAGKVDPTTRAYLVEDLEHEPARRAALALAVATLEVRDRQTADHCDDVLTLCEAIGSRLDFDDRALQHLLAGAQLHDVGKVAVPTTILNKPGPLSEDEWAVIREHTIIGERILRSVPEMAEVATIVRHSHEHWDGSGYPDGLAGEQIPLASRVILCADAFHAIRSDRPYRNGRPARDAIAELEASAGTQLDPAVVGALVAVAGQARSERAGSAIGPPNKRLVVLLTALVIGGGSAVAGIPQLREAIRSVFAATPTPGEAVAADPRVGEFDFGPLGDLLRLKPAAHRDRKTDRKHEASRAEPDAKDRRGSGRPGPGAAVRGQGGAGGEGGGGSLVAPPAPVPDVPQGTAPTGDSSPGETPTAKSHGNGHGHAQGHSMPTPRRPAQPPRPTQGRPDPPALGHTKQQHGKAKGHAK